MSEPQGTRWCFTINNPISDRTLDENDIFWDNSPGSDSQEPMTNIQYLILQEERGENGTLHWQGFLILKKKQKLTWLKRHLNARAHWEIARGTNQQAADYCRKGDTYTGGLRIELGEMPIKAAPGKHAERLQKAAEELDVIKEGYKRPSEIDSYTLMQCGFLPAYKELTADVLGPYRPNLQIITLIGPPGCGKSYAIQHFFPEHGRVICGNNGVWFQQPLSKVMVLEEFSGQIPLQRMLQLLDPYPAALEIKGGMRPAMYETFIITSNTSPRWWYRADETSSDPKRWDAIHALWDRLNYSDGSYIPVRQTGLYIECSMGPDWLGRRAEDFIESCRTTIWNTLSQHLQIDPIEDE